MIGGDTIHNGGDLNVFAETVEVETGVIISTDAGDIITVFVTDGSTLTIYGDTSDNGKPYTGMKGVINIGLA